MAEGGLDILSRPRVRDFISTARVARLATADSSATPHVVPVCFWFDGRDLYFVIDEKPKLRRGTGLKRMRNIAENPRVAVVIDHYEEDWSELAYVLIRGLACLAEEPGEYLRALRALRDKYWHYRTMALSADKNPAVKIRPQRVHVWGRRFEASEVEPARR